jgi:hypothetical protein
LKQAAKLCDSSKCDSDSKCDSEVTSRLLKFFLQGITLLTFIMETLSWILLLLLVAGVVWLVVFSEPTMVVIDEGGEYTMKANTIYRIDATSAVTLTFPSAATGDKWIRVTKAAVGGAVTFALAGDDTYNGTATPPTALASNAYGSVAFVNDRVAGWYDL